MSEERRRRSSRELARREEPQELELAEEAGALARHDEARDTRRLAPDLDERWALYVVIGAVVLGLLSFFVLAPWASSPATHGATIASLDEKKATVTTLMGSSTASSAAITLLPGDVATPIAEKLVDLSSDFLIVLTAIYLEKYLLTTMGFIAFKVLVPLGCALVAVGVALTRGWRLWTGFAGFGLRLVLFAVAAYCVVPASTFVSSMIERTYEASIAETLAQAEQTAQDIEEATGEEEGGEESSQTWLEALQGVGQTITELPGTLTSRLEGLTEEAQQALNNFIDALAVMIVTSCVIPILVLLCFLWLAKAIFGIEVDLPRGTFRGMPRHRR